MYTLKFSWSKHRQLADVSHQQKRNRGFSKLDTRKESFSRLCKENKGASIEARLTAAGVEANSQAVPNPKWLNPKSLRNLSQKL